MAAEGVPGEHDRPVQTRKQLSPAAFRL